MNVNICECCDQRIPSGTGYEVEMLGPRTVMDGDGTFHYCTWTCMAKDAELNSAGGTR
jgi:hypothetical protein